MNATQNLALYCASAVLEAFPIGDYAPSLPPPGERAANTGSALTATVEPWRKLTYINMWLLERFDQATQQAFTSSMRVPTWDLQVPDFDPKTRSLVTMAAGPQFIIPPNHLPLPEGIQGVREWVYHLPLRTAERIMKLINNDSHDWVLNINQTTNQLSHLYTTCAWGLRSQSARAEPNVSSGITTHLLFVIQSPWLLSPADFKIFCERSMYRHYAKKDPKTGKVEVTQLDYVDKLWATIYDDCVRGDTHYFVLTTYNEWAFGAFSRGWTTAWITPPKPYNAGSASVPGPTILQSLLFWMHSAQQFSFTERYGASQDQDEYMQPEDALPTPVSAASRDTSPTESDFESETDDNTLDKGWLNEMRANRREIKDMKGAQRLSANGSWLIPEIWEDLEPPRMPPKRTLDPSSIEDPELLEDWCNKRKRPLNDEHITMRKYPRRGPQNHVSPSSLRANSSLSKSVSSTSTRVLPGGFPSDSSGSDWSPWMSETRIFWTRAFMSVRSSLADALSRLLRSREEERRSVSVSAVSLAFTTSAASSSRASIQLPGGLDALSEAETVLEVEPPERPEQDGDDGPTPLSRLPTLLDIPQTTIALGGHTIQLNSPQPPRLLSGIRLAQPDENAWPPPRRPLRPSPRMPEAERSGATEADLDAQRRPECGYRDNTPSVHANSIYEM